MGLDDAALHAAYRRLEKPMFNVLYRWLWDAAECMDVMHDAFLRVWSRRAQVREDGLDALLYATALNLARNRRRWHAPGEVHQPVGGVVRHQHLVKHAREAVAILQSCCVRCEVGVVSPFRSPHHFREHSPELFLVAHDEDPAIACAVELAWRK